MRNAARLLAAAVNQVPQFTLLAWVRCPQSASAAWWFDEDLAGKSLMGLGSGNDLQLRAFSKSKQKTCDPIHLHEACRRRRSNGTSSPCAANSATAIRG